MADSFQIEKTFFTAKDGTKLSVTLRYPKNMAPGEKYPVILEMIPYRKDDLFFLYDFSFYEFFADKGLIFAKVDVRGTGSSSGAVPLREYSESELSDAEELIHWLAHLPASNGNIGMWGISWGGFNAIQVAMRNPPELRAIIATDATDDLFKDDVHYVDGIFHMDEYMLDMDHEVALPAPPSFEISDQFIKDRLESYPWLLTYMHQQRDNPFWSSHSLKGQYEKIKIPVFMIGGILDTYRDSIPRMMSALSVPRKALMGPWTHNWPDEGGPGPKYEWRNEAVAWWNRWLKDSPKEKPAENEYVVYIRDSFQPSIKAEFTPGTWCDFNKVKTVAENFWAGPNQSLQLQTFSKGADLLSHRAGVGTAIGFYWGEMTASLKDSYEDELSYDSSALSEDLVFAGMPKVKISMVPDQEQLHWVARLEDVYPNGEIAFVTGAALNGSQRGIRTSPTPFNPGVSEDIEIDLHFSSWTFRKGHKIRLTLANESFPMLWPSPKASTNLIHLKNTGISLPIITSSDFALCQREAPPVIVQKPKYPDPSFNVEDESNNWPANQRVYTRNNWKFLDAIGDSEYNLNDLNIKMREAVTHKVNLENQAEAGYHGKISHRYESSKRWFQLNTEIEINSDAKYFFVNIGRVLTSSDHPKAEKYWQEKIPRDFQ